MLGLLVVPITIEQYPEIFKESHWVLPASVLLVMAFWIVPVLIHERAKRLWNFGYQRFGVGPTSIAVLLVICLGTLFLSKMYSSHVRHLESRLKERVSGTATPEKEKPISKETETPQTQTEKPRKYLAGHTALPVCKHTKSGLGPDSYKDVCDEDVINWALEESNKIRKMAQEADDNITKGALPNVPGSLSQSIHAQQWFFSMKYKDSLLSGYKSNKVNWLPISSKSLSQSDA